MPTVDERARAMRELAYEEVMHDAKENFRELGYSVRFGIMRGEEIGEATAINQLDEARAVALEEAARVAEAQWDNVNPVHATQREKVACGRIAAAIRALGNLTANKKPQP